MALLFSSGGGRLGNQLLNIIHLMAISYEHDLKVKKINDNYIRAKNNSLIFEIGKNMNNWRIVNSFERNSFFYKFYLKIYIRLIHLIYSISPRYKSYKISIFGNNLNYIFAHKLKEKFYSQKIINESQKKNIVVSGWGLRDWDLVFKHQDLIKKNIDITINGDIPKINKLDKQDYILVHIRRGDFLKIDDYKELNFSDQLWFNSIMKICSENLIQKVIIFSDEEVSKSISDNLNHFGIRTSFPEKKKDSDFLKLFVESVENASAIICNASTLVMSLSFIYHNKIYIPSNDLNKYKEVVFSEAHIKKPTCLNWN